jgi:hypothetical protein
MKVLVDVLSSEFGDLQSILELGFPEFQEISLG